MPPITDTDLVNWITSLNPFNITIVENRES